MFQVIQVKLMLLCENNVIVILKIRFLLVNILINSAIIKKLEQ